jgi:hypothetical protein
VAILSALTACANTAGGSGGEDKMSMSYLKQHIVVNQSTKADVVQLFGEPNYKAEKPDGADYWSYSETQVNGTDYMAEASKYLSNVSIMGGAAAKSQARPTNRELHVFFNAKGTVRSFDTSGSTGAGS